MDLSLLHFSHPLWLWAGLAIPLAWIVYCLFYTVNRPTHQLEKFIDSHLLPYLLMNPSNKKRSVWKYLFLWSAVWSCLTLALAGPRWSFREMETFSKDQSLVVLLDLSDSMNAADIKPSRLAWAKQKIEDLINQAKGVKIGLVAFAADPHMITPLTDDIETIRHLLPSIDTDLVYVQGSRLSPALEMAQAMLDAEPGTNKAVLAISDGGFEDASAILTAKKLTGKGVVIHALGVGTLEGAPIKDQKGNVVKKNGVPVLSKFEKERFGEISKIGNGHFLEAHHDESVILNDLEKRAEAQMAMGKINRIWDESFYFLIFPLLPIFLWWFRRGSVFGFALLLFLPSFTLQADAADYFKNTEQLGKKALDGGDYEAAGNLFQDPYRKGVSCYRAGNFAEAEKMFSQSTREEVACSAGYNLGNSLVQQQKLKEAIAAYEDVLKKWPDHTKAKENLELVKKMLEQQKQDKSDQKNSDKQENQNEDQKDKDPKNNDSGNKEQNESQDRDNQEQDNKESGKEQESQPQDHKGSEKEKKPQSNEGQNEEHQDKQQEESQPTEEGADAPQNEKHEGKPPKTQEDYDADALLNRIDNDPKTFMKNKFYIESKKSGTTEGLDPW